MNSSRSSTRALSTSPFARAEPVVRERLVLAVGDRVTHDSLGCGKVVTAGASHVTVDFGGGVVRSIACDEKGLAKL